MAPRTSSPITLRFATLWANYPDEPPCVDQNGDKPAGWDNQCAVRVGVALERSGVSFSSFHGARCPFGSGASGMVGSAQELANWLNTKPFANCPKVQHVAVAKWKETVAHHTGILFFQDYWRRHGERTGSGSGDHIDLWNKDRLPWSVQSVLRFRLGVDHVPNLNPFTRDEDNLNWYSDLGKSRAIWFWNIT